MLSPPHTPHHANCLGRNVAPEQTSRAFLHVLGCGRPISRGRRRGVVKRIMVATDRSEGATRAVDWAAEMSERFGAELHLLQVVVPENEPGTEAGMAESTRASAASNELARLAQQLAGPRGRGQYDVDVEPSMTDVQAAEDAGG